MDETTLGERIASARRRAGLSQREAARRTGMRRQRISAIERAVNLHSATITRFARLYGVTVAELIGEVTA